jgi:hypothetical protein
MTLSIKISIRNYQLDLQMVLRMFRMDMERFLKFNSSSVFTVRRIKKMEKLKVRDLLPTLVDWEKLWQKALKW